MLSVKQEGTEYHFFLVFGMTQPGTEPRFPKPLANTLTALSDDTLFLKLFHFSLFDLFKDLNRIS